MAEGLKAPIEYGIGAGVIILQHDRCLGSYGRVTEMNGKTPITASCNNCGKIINVDLGALPNPSHPRKRIR